MDSKFGAVMFVLVCVAGISCVDIDATQERDVPSDQTTTDTQTRVKRTIGIDESYEREYELKTKKGTTLTVKKSIKYNDGGAIVHAPVLIESLADKKTKILAALKKGNGASASATATANAAASSAPAPPPQVVVVHQVDPVPVPVPVLPPPTPLQVVEHPPILIHEESPVGPSHPLVVNYGEAKKQSLFREALPMVKLGHRKLFSGERRGLLNAYRKSADTVDTNEDDESNDLVRSRPAKYEDGMGSEESVKKVAEGRSAQKSWSQTEADLIQKVSVGLVKIADGKKIGAPCCPDGPCCSDPYEH